MSTTSRRPIPIYASNGEPGALLLYPYLFNLQGEWVGWITPQREVYSILGIYIGYITDDPRILRKRTSEVSLSRKVVPTSPAHIQPPAVIPLAPMMSDISFDLVDVLWECPEELHTIDAGELREDMD